MNKTLTFIAIILLLPNLFIGQMKKENMSENNEIRQKIETFRNSGLPQSGIEYTDEIMKKALSDKNTIDFIIALTANMEFRQFVTEDADAVFIDELEAMLPTLWIPAKNIVHSFTADRYQAFYSNNRWKLLEQKAVETNSSDVREMSAAELSAKTMFHYQESLKDAVLLQKENSDNYKPLFMPNSGKYDLRPSLYDVLAVKAIETLLSDALYKEPAQSDLILENPLILGDLEQFLSIKIDNTTQNAVLSGITVLQEWLNYRKKENNFSALADADLLRLQTMKNIFTSDDADDLYEQALDKLSIKSKNTPVYASILYTKADFLNKLSNDYSYDFPYEISENYETNTETQRNFLKEALQIAQQAIETYPESEGAIHCKLLIENINSQELTLIAEKNVSIGENITYNTRYRNVPKGHIYLYKLTDSENFKSLNEQEVFAQIEKIKPLRTEIIEIPDFGDYKSHSAEASIKGINETGLYSLVIASTPLHDNIAKTNLFSAAVFRVTNLALINRNEKNIDLAVVNRITGEPIKGAELQIYENNRGKIEKGTILKSDENGCVKYNIPSSTNYVTRYVAVKHGNDIFVSEGMWWQPSQNQQQRFNERFFLFTDRKIYRPGQIVWFKGILMETDGKKAKSVERKKVEVSLHDVNGKKISTQTFVTNEFGSVSGRFLLPSDILPGNFMIRSDKGSQSISVENYKRPRFEVILNPYNGLAMVGDEVKITGKSIDMTGFPLQGASYRWQVVRERNFWRGWMPTPSTSEPIASGTGIIDETGNFEIAFIATAKKEKYVPYWRGNSFKIEVDVTDTNGETRSTTQRVTIDEKVYIPTITLYNENIFSGNELSVVFSLRNMSDNAVKGEIKYKIERLDVPAEVQPASRWDVDAVVGKGILPQREKNRNELWKQWKTAKLIKEQKLTIDGTSNENIKFDTPLSEGVYKITMEIADKKGKIQKSEERFNVITGKDFNPGTGLLVAVPQTEYVRGETAKVMIFSSFKQGSIFLSISNGGKIIHEQVIKANSKDKTISLPIKDEMTGNISVNAVIINRNREYEISNSFMVKNEERNLKLKLSTFREQVLPGSKENWTLTVLDHNNKPIKTEMLALMYDASLDQFKPNQMGFNLFYDHSSSFPWQTQNSFGTIYGWGRNNYLSSIKFPENFNQSYPVFNWNIFMGYNYNTRSRQMHFGSVPTGAPVMAKGAVMLEESVMDAAMNVNDMDMEERISAESDTNQSNLTTNTLRSNFNETAFFMPELFANDKGESTFSFTLPESITKWRFMAFAHNKEGASGITEQFITASKELMVVPNLPRIMREGDELTLPAKIINSSSKDISGTAQLTAKDAITGEIVKLNETSINWNVSPNGSANVEWKIVVPQNVKGLMITVTADSDLHKDGEERLIPVLPVMMQITETMPVTLTGKGKHKIEMESLVNSKNENHQSFTFTYTQNAAYEILDVLPWLIERPYKSADQVFNKYFAATVAKQIFKENPALVNILKAWAAALPGDEDALLSAFEKNPELKQIALSATPWLTHAKNDVERRRQLALLVTDGYLESEQAAALSKLAALQKPDGGWSWYDGMTTSSFITSEIIAGFGYLKKLKTEQSREIEQITSKGVSWLLDDIKKSMNDAIKQQEKSGTKEIVASHTVIKNLYAVSFFINKNISEQETFWLEKIKSDYLKDDVTRQAMLATLYSRYGNQQESGKLLRSVSEKAIKGNRNEQFFRADFGPFWHQAPIEKQVAVLEMLYEVDKNNKLIAGLEDWLITQKRTQSWNTTRATLSAVYALAISPRNLFEVTKTDEIKVGDNLLTPPQTVSGTGYFSQTWNKTEISSKLGKVEITKNSDVPSWVSLHWNYLKEEKEVKKGGFLEVDKKIFKMTLNKGVQEWTPISDATKLIPGDKILVQLIVETPQSLDFVYVNDKRASSLEPIDIFSGYRYQSGLGYYASVTDAGADFFIDRLPKGKYTFTYELVVSHKGYTTSGPAVVECFYAPEFSGHSGGMRVRSGD